MMSEAGANVFMREEEASADTSNKLGGGGSVSPTRTQPPPETTPNDQHHHTDARTVTCTNQQMAPIVAKAEALKNTLVRKFTTSKQLVLEQMGKAQKTVDTEMDNRIQSLYDLHNRYKDLLTAARAFSTHFNALNNAQRMLAESFYQLSLREHDLKESLTDRSETTRHCSKQGDECAKELELMLSSLDTLVHKTIVDTLITVQAYENARLEYDAARHDLTLLQQQPEASRKNADELQATSDSMKKKYELLKEDVRVKLALLDENRLKVMKAQLAQFEKALSQYYTECIKTLAQNSPKAEDDSDANFVRGVAHHSSSFLEQ